MTLVQKIKMLAKSKGVPVSTVEVTLGFAGGAISKWDHNVPAADKVLRVAEYFGTTTDYLLRNDIDNPLTAADLEHLPVAYYHLLNGVRELELNRRDVEFLLEVARSYKNASRGHDFE